MLFSPDWLAMSLRDQMNIMYQYDKYIKFSDYPKRCMKYIKCLEPKEYKRPRNSVKYQWLLLYHCLNSQLETKFQKHEQVPPPQM